jgi:hypothetical protein
MAPIKVSADGADYADLFFGQQPIENAHLSAARVPIVAAMTPVSVSGVSLGVI